MEDNIDNQSEDNKNIIKDPSKNNNLKRPLKDVQGNRRNTYPSKAFKFKISSLEESEVISKVCDNIFEDVNIKQKKYNMNNKSMKNLFSNIDLNKKGNAGNKINIIDVDTININDENKSIANSKSSNKESKKNDNKEGDDEKDDSRSRTHRDSFMFNNLLIYNSTKIPKSLEDDWTFEKILIDYNIIDFTSK